MADCVFLCFFNGLALGWVIVLESGSCAVLDSVMFLRLRDVFFLVEVEALAESDLPLGFEAVFDGSARSGSSGPSIGSTCCGSISIPSARRASGRARRAHTSAAK